MHTLCLLRIPLRLHDRCYYAIHAGRYEDADFQQHERSQPELTRPLLVARASLLVSNEVGADGFTRCVFDGLVVGNILRAMNLDFAMVGLACFYRLERR